jgi:hypothetical protein
VKLEPRHGVILDEFSKIFFVIFQKTAKGEAHLIALDPSL